MRVSISYNFPKRVLVETILLRPSSELAKPEDQLFLERVTELSLTAEEHNATLSSWDAVSE